jgi:hypothetical protein
VLALDRLYLERFRDIKCIVNQVVYQHLDRKDNLDKRGILDVFKSITPKKWKKLVLVE